ncbi:MAG: hypothetical protein WAL71_12310 [Terriglobales bacterium]|jgi:hypothetical protein
MKKYLVFVVCIVAISVGANGQSGARPILRIERAQPGEAVCALVNEDGRFRVEKLYRDKNEMYAGWLQPTSMDSMPKLVANDQLSKASQADIHEPLIADASDAALQIAIDREDGWQVLTFLSSTARKPLRDSIDPLVQWFQDLQKTHPSATRVQGTPTRCALPSDARMIGTATATTASPAAVKSQNFLFRVKLSHVYGATPIAIAQSSLETAAFIGSTASSATRRTATIESWRVTSIQRRSNNFRLS